MYLLWYNTRPQVFNKKMRHQRVEQKGKEGKMTEREKQDLKTMWERGVPISQISRLFPYKEYLVRGEIKSLEKSGFLPPRNASRMCDEGVVTRYLEGEDINVIANEHGFTVRKVYYILKRNGVSRKKTKNFVKGKCSEKTEAIKEAIKCKKSLSEIARDFGVSRQYVHQIKEKINEGLI